MTFILRRCHQSKIENVFDTNDNYVQFHRNYVLLLYNTYVYTCLLQRFSQLFLGIARNTADDPVKVFISWKIFLRKTSSLDHRLRFEVHPKKYENRYAN